MPLRRLIIVKRVHTSDEKYPRLIRLDNLPHLNAIELPYLDQLFLQFNL